MRQIGEAMREGRRRRGYSAAELADRAGVSRTHLYAAEKNRVYPGILFLCACADVLGISIDDYIGREVPGVSKR